MSALPSPADIVDSVAKALLRDGALVEFISYEDRPRVPGPSASQAPLRYLALVLLPDASTRALDLGLAEPIDSAASRLRVALANRDADFQVHAQELYRLAFQPLLPLLGKARRLYLSPDGSLALVPIAALHDGQQFLVDAFDFTYLTSGKDLLPRLQESAPAVSVDVLADPDFSAPLVSVSDWSFFWSPTTGFGPGRLESDGLLCLEAAGFEAAARSFWREGSNAGVRK